MCLRSSLYGQLCYAFTDIDNEKIDLAKDICVQSETYVTPPKSTIAGNQQVKFLSQQTGLRSDAVDSSLPANLANYKDLIIATLTIPGNMILVAFDWFYHHWFRLCHVADNLY